MSKFAPHSRSTPHASATTVCQKCLKTGHFTYECKSPRPYVSRPSRTQMLENPEVLAKLKADGKPSVEVPEEFTTKTGTANRILEEKEKEREKEKEPTSDRRKKARRSRRSGSSNLDSSTSDSSSDSDSDSDTTSTSDSDSDSSTSDSSSTSSSSSSSSGSSRSRERDRRRRVPRRYSSSPLPSYQPGPRR
ncbi:hypothetical protein SCLCIDRAFT_1211940 [Scleroderma citrinum Foug A]|uniref:CCHC-type domain-containing protein n=1 Tax=Scleroderma citrinum Foug A TaxID=1036808 RepID=A0A0C2ZWT9_9AGAM|nr:hypothetical protein SCLCIDRAFT_1211940 [Scleroderma citrinum Foug A]